MSIASAFKNGEWLRVAGELIPDDCREARKSMLDAYPSLQETLLLKKDAQAVIPKDGKQTPTKGARGLVNLGFALTGAGAETLVPLGIAIFGGNKVFL